MQFDVNVIDRRCGIQPHRLQAVVVYHNQPITPGTADFTKTPHGWVRCLTSINLRFRMPRRQTARLVIDTLIQALRSRTGTERVLHHSDSCNKYLSSKPSEHLVIAVAESSASNPATHKTMCLPGYLPVDSRRQVLIHHWRCIRSMASERRPETAQSVQLLRLRVMIGNTSPSKKELGVLSVIESVGHG